MPQSAPLNTVLAIDIGGTKMLGALVTEGEVSMPVQIATPTDGNPDQWLAKLLDAAPGWTGRYSAVGAAVTGLIVDGFWSSLNPNTLPVPPDYPLAKSLVRLTGTPALVVNDAQAAAWGEFALGAGQGTRNCVFLTVSTGIGGGVVANGQLLTGLAGHFGQFLSEIPGDAPFESHAAGRWIAKAACAVGHDVDARAVFEAAKRGEGWAETICELSARQLAVACANIQLALAPERIVIGGSIGLAAGYIDRINKALSELPLRQRPSLIAAQLGTHAGIVGIAQLALTSTIREVNNRGKDNV